MPHNPPQPEALRQLDESVAEVFAVMLNLACTAASAPASVPEAPCFIASVSFSGSVEGSCSMHLTSRTAADLTSNLTGIPATQIPPDLCADTAAELCNMIAGSWKTRQPAERAACQLSCPTVTLGQPVTASPAFTALYQVSGHYIALQLTLN